MAREIKICPSCGGSEITVDGKLLYCATCDVTFEITDRGAKVRDADPLKEDRERLSRIEQDVAAIKSRLDTRTPPAEPKPTGPPEENENEYGEGFVVLDGV